MYSNWHTTSTARSTTLLLYHTPNYRGPTHPRSSETAAEWYPDRRLEKLRCGGRRRSYHHCWYQSQRVGDFCRWTYHDLDTTNGGGAAATEFPPNLHHNAADFLQAIEYRFFLFSIIIFFFFIWLQYAQVFCQ